MLDLHCHTTYSDGRLTPAELIEVAVSAGVRALAITDHDTVSGWDEAFAAAKIHNLEIVPGLELSTAHNSRSLHILGFYPDPNQLRAPLTECREGRKLRAQRIAARLAELGYSICLPVLGEGMAPGRPHIATALVKAGYVRSSREAFERLLGDDQVAYVHYEKFSSVEGIALLRSCGAVPVWAHPYLFRGGKLEEVLSELVAVGLMGVEVYHPSHTPTQQHNLKQLCVHYGLLMTGGSDYHGPRPDAKGAVAHSLNSLHLPLSLLSLLKQAVQGV